MSESEIKESILAKESEYRGAIMSATVYLERSIDVFIMKYMSDDDQKRGDIHLFLLDRLSFDAKISILQAILQRDNSKEHFKKTYEKLIGKIRMAKDERNIFAHYSVGISKESLSLFPKEIRFLSLRNKLEFKVYDDEKVNGIITVIQDCTISITNIL